MGKYDRKAEKGKGIPSDLVAANALLWIANELAEANRLKRLELIRKERVILENPYSEADDIKVAKQMLKELEDQA